MNAICLAVGFVLGGITGAFIYSFIRRYRKPWEYGPQSVWDDDDIEWDDDHFDSLKDRGRDDPRESR